MKRAVIPSLAMYALFSEDDRDQDRLSVLAKRCPGVLWGTLAPDQDVVLYFDADDLKAIADAFREILDADESTCDAVVFKTENTSEERVVALSLENFKDVVRGTARLLDEACHDNDRINRIMFEEDEVALLDQWRRIFAHIKDMENVNDLLGVFSSATPRDPFGAVFENEELDWVRGMVDFWASEPGMCLRSRHASFFSNEPLMMRIAEKIHDFYCVHEGECGKGFSVDLPKT